MFKKIIIASEISKGEYYVVKCLKELRKFGTEKCLVLQNPMTYPGEPTVSSFISDITEQHLLREKEILEEAGYDVETRMIHGNIKYEINRIAMEEDYSLIVAGAPKHTWMGELFFGGAAYEVIHHASKPVLLIRVDENKKEGNLMEHILFPTDFSANADITLEYIKEMISAGLKKVTIVHILERTTEESYLSESITELIDYGKEKLEKIKEDILKVGDIEIEAEVIFGSPSAEVLRIIDEQNISLVVMGSQGRGFIQEIYLGSVSHNIARHSNASVLLIPAKRD